MPRVQENSIASSLHYALTDSQCSVCGAQPKAITMAEQLKDKASLDKKTKLRDGSNIEAEDI